MPERPRTAENLAATLASARFEPLGSFDPPQGAGLYAIKLAPLAWAGTVLEHDERAAADVIAYVGKAEGHGRGVAKRWLSEHLAAHSGRSSPRRSWLAVLAPTRGLPIYPRPCKPGNKPNVNCYVSDRNGEQWLRSWIERNYRVASLPLKDSEVAQVESLEKRVINILWPYANDGTPHPLWAEVFDPGRKALIAEARRRLSAGELLELAHHRD